MLLNKLFVRMNITSNTNLIMNEYLVVGSEDYETDKRSIMERCG